VGGPEADDSAESGVPSEAPAAPVALARWSDAVGTRERGRESGLARKLKSHLSSSAAIAKAGRVALGAIPESAPWAFTGQVRIPAPDLGREFMGEPVPMLARLTRRKSDVPLRLWALGWLWGCDPVRDTEGFPWEDALLAGPSDDVAARQSLRRAIPRARLAVEQDVSAYKSEMEAWRASPARSHVRAWGTPYRPDFIVMPTTLWARGWHLALGRGDFAWLAASFLPNDRRLEGRSLGIRNAMRDRYLGFTRNINGIEQARFARDHLDQPAPQVLAADLLTQSLPRCSELRWPYIRLEPGELPERGFRATLDGGRVLVLKTNLYARVHRATKDGDFWAEDQPIPLRVPELGIRLDQVPHDSKAGSSDIFLVERNTVLRKFTDVRDIWDTHDTRDWRSSARRA